MPGTSILKPFQLLGAVSALVLMTSLAHLPGQRNAAPAFRSAHVVSATDVPYPMQSIAIGTVVLEVTVSETGQVENVLPIREIDSLTEVATDSVKNWQFTSASLDGKPMRSRTTVAVTFNPAAIPAANVPLPPVSPKAHSRDGTLPPQPIDVLAASFPQYPSIALPAEQLYCGSRSMRLGKSIRLYRSVEFLLSLHPQFLLCRNGSSNPPSLMASRCVLPSL